MPPPTDNAESERVSAIRLARVRPARRGANRTQVYVALIGTIGTIVVTVLTTSPRARHWTGISHWTGEETADGAEVDGGIAGVAKRELSDHDRLEDIDRRLTKLEVHADSTQKEVDAIFGAVVGRRVDPSMPEPTSTPR